MKPRFRMLIATSTFCLAMILCAGWAWEYLDDQRTAAIDAARELTDCRDLARQITAARLTPAATHRRGDITTAIASAAAQAGLAEANLDHIDPGSARINPDGSMIQRRIDLSIRQGTLRQITTFAHALSSPPIDLRAARIRLRPSDAEGGGWAAEMTLTNPDSGDLTR